MQLCFATDIFESRETVICEPRSTNRVAVLTSYEIRIVRQDGQVLVIESRLMGDHAAVRRARTLAIAGDQVEVWRGMVCIFETVTGAAIIP